MLLVQYLLLRACLRTQNSLLILYMSEFSRLWASLDGAGSQCGTDGSFRRRFNASYNDRDAAARRISEYVGAFDSAMKRFFALLDDPDSAKAEVVKIHSAMRSV